MRCKCDSAVEWVTVYTVGGNEVVVSRRRFVTEQNSARVVLYNIVTYD